MDKKKILICDDDPGIIDMLELILEDTNHQIITELDSLKVLGLMEKEKPDLLLLDLWMPVLSGDQLLKAIRINSLTAKLPVIVISASRDGKEIAFAAGASDFLEKPFDIDELLAKVDLYLQ
jgi:DNA-binding response OmpR family regulator